MASDKPIKIIPVGDLDAGKTELLHSFAMRTIYTDGTGPEYVPTVFDNYSETYHDGTDTVTLEFWDTAGQEEYDMLRKLSYPMTDVFLVMFSLTDRTQLENVKKLWAPEVRAAVPDAKLILVGTHRSGRDAFLDALVRERVRSSSAGANALPDCISKDKPLHFQSVKRRFSDLDGKPLELDLDLVAEPIAESKVMYNAAFDRVLEREGVSEKDLLALSDLFTVTAPPQGQRVRQPFDERKFKKPDSEKYFLHLMETADRVQELLKEKLVGIENAKKWKPVDKVTGEVGVIRLAVPWLDEAFDPGIKSRSRVLEKAKFKYNSDYDERYKYKGEERCEGDFRYVKDISRLALQFPTFERLMDGARVIAGLFAEGSIVDVDNRFASPTPLGWRDLVVFISLQVGEGDEQESHVVEVQLHHLEMSQARKGAHAHYRRLREALQAKVVPRDTGAVTDTIVESLVEDPSAKLQLRSARDAGRGDDAEDGSQGDLATSETLVGEHEGRAVAEEIEAVAYLETSAWNPSECDAVMRAAVRSVVGGGDIEGSTSVGLLVSKPLSGSNQSSGGGCCVLS